MILVSNLGPDVPKTIVMNAVTDTPSLLLNNQTELAAKYAKMAKPQLKIIQVNCLPHSPIVRAS